jgi:hypothetical protein
MILVRRDTQLSSAFLYQTVIFALQPDGTAKGSLTYDASPMAIGNSVRPARELSSKVVVRRDLRCDTIDHGKKIVLRCDYVDAAA